MLQTQLVMVVSTLGLSQQNYTADAASVDAGLEDVSCCMTCTSSSSFCTVFLRKAKEVSLGVLLAESDAFAASPSLSSDVTWFTHGNVTPCSHQPGTWTHAR